MIKLNLLSDKEKEKRKAEDKIGSILSAGFSTIFVLLLLLAITLSAQLVLNINLKSAQEESRVQSDGKSLQEIAEAEKILAELNTISQKIKISSGEMPHWSKVMARISGFCPPDLKITSIHAEKEHLKLNGFSKTREAFLEFQEGLRQDGFANLVSPVSNLVSPKDFNFSIEVDLRNDYLNQP